jgi:hypothetical protein
MEQHDEGGCAITFIVHSLGYSRLNVLRQKKTRLHTIAPRLVDNIIADGAVASGASAGCVLLSMGGVDNHVKD